VHAVCVCYLFVWDENFILVYRYVLQNASIPGIACFIVITNSQYHLQTTIFHHKHMYRNICYSCTADYHSFSHSINQSIKPCVQSVRVHAAPCAPMCLNSRPCGSMRAHASFSTTGISHNNNNYSTYDCMMTTKYIRYLIIDSQLSNINTIIIFTVRTQSTHGPFAVVQWYLPCAK